MNAQVSRTSYATPLITAVAVILLGTVGVANMMSWGAGTAASAGKDPSPGLPAPVAPGPAPAGPRCPECAVIVSTEGSEIVVRMADGSIRTIPKENSARWRIGERLILIAGADPPRP